MVDDEKVVQKLLAEIQVLRKRTLEDLSAATYQLENGNWAIVGSMIGHAAKDMKLLRDREHTYRNYYSKKFGKLDLKTLKRVA